MSCGRTVSEGVGDGPWAGRTLHDLYTEAHTPWEWHAPLFEAAHAAGIQIFSTPFDPTAVELLESLGAKAYKIASFELVDDALLRCVAATGKPVILSTGMADLEEIEHALSTLRSGGASALALLRCTSSYPAPDDAMNLHSIGELMRRFDLPVGLSDHSEGTLAPVVSIALGACMVEKHFTLAREDGGVDSHFSLEPAELRQLVDDVRRAERMLGEARFGVADAERESAIFRRSLYVVEDVRAGEAFSEANVRSIRPGFGLAPRHLDAVLGRRASRPLARGTPLRWDALESR